MPPKTTPRPSEPAGPGSEGGHDLPHLPGAWIGSEAFSGVATELAEAERFFCTFDLAPARCTRRDCRQALSCRSGAPAGTIHRECRGRPGAHVRSWVLGLWLSRLHDLMRPEGGEAGEGAPKSRQDEPKQKRRRAFAPAPRSLDA